MATIGVFPPNETSRTLLQSVPGTRLTPGVVSALDGPRSCGPETAGAVTLLHTTFAGDASAQQGYEHFTTIKENFRNEEGFLRWLTFSDGPHGYALGMWRSVDDVLGFVKGEAHRAMAARQRQQPFEYSQFAGVWTAHTIGRRTIYCERCRHATPTPAAACGSCANMLHDPFLGQPL